MHPHLLITEYNISKELLNHSYKSENKSKSIHKRLLFVCTQNESYALPINNSLDDNHIRVN